MRKAPYPRRPKQGKGPVKTTTMGGCLYYTAAARRLQGVKMKVGLLDDLRYACSAFESARTARRQQRAVPPLKPCVCVPVIHFSYWYSSMEGTLFSGEQENLIKTVFKSFDPQTQHDLTFTPKAAGDWIARANLWRSALKHALPAEWYYPTMSKIYAHYRKCIMRRKAADRI